MSARSGEAVRMPRRAAAKTTTFARRDIPPHPSKPPDPAGRSGGVAGGAVWMSGISEIAAGGRNDGLPLIFKAERKR